MLEDWYVHGESGSLHWYDGNYEDEGLDTPEGLSHLGDDEFFGETGLEVIGVMERRHDNEDNEDDFMSFNLPADVSESMANFSGFKKAISEEVVEIEEMTTYYTNERGQNEATTYPPNKLKSLSSEYTYVENNKRIQSTDREYLYNVGGRGNHKGTYMIEHNIERWTYDYNNKNNSATRDQVILFIIETIGDIISIMK